MEFLEVPGCCKFFFAPDVDNYKVEFGGVSHPDYKATSGVGSPGLPLGSVNPGMPSGKGNQGWRDHLQWSHIPNAGSFALTPIWPKCTLQCSAAQGVSDSLQRHRVSLYWFGAICFWITFVPSR